MKYKHYIYSVQIIISIALLLMLLLVYKTIHIQEVMRVNETEKYHSIHLAYELFQSTEDLTRMARKYVITGHHKYKTNYLKILAIRNGTHPRLSHYNPIFWHLDNFIVKKEELISLDELMQKSNFTVEEVENLILSEHNSNKLVEKEKDAFKLSETNNRQSAIKLLFDTEYIREKEKIMRPIQSVLDSIDKRTTKTLKRNQGNLQLYTYFLLVVLALSIFGLFFAFIYTRKKYIEPLKKLSETDPLTGLINRRHFFEIAEENLQIAKKLDTPFSLLIIDLDYFKKINDSYGHITGDNILIKLSELFRKNLRSIDTICRWGGDEFIILLPNTDIKSCIKTGNLLTKLSEKSIVEVIHNIQISFTVSIGATVFNNTYTSIDEMIATADKALYQVKKTGKNNFCIL